MTEGLYSYRGKIYYGKYDEQQAKGKVSMIRVKSENIMTDYPIKEDDWAVCFCDNHALLQPEYDDLRICIDVALKLEGRCDLVDLDFSEKEENLEASFPLVLKYIYSAISGQAHYFEGAEHFIPLEDLYIDQWS